MKNETNNNAAVTSINIVKAAKQAQKSLLENLSTTDTTEEAIVINNNLLRVDTITNHIKALNSEKSTILIDTIKLLNDYIKALKSEDSFKNYSKKPLIKIVKSKLDTKNNLVTTVLNYLEEGLTINHGLNKSSLDYLYKSFVSERISKTTLKKSTSELQEVIKTLRTEDKETKIKELIKTNTVA